MAAPPSPRHPAFQFHTAAMSNVRYHYTLMRLAGLWPLPTDPPALRYIAHIFHLISFVLFNGLMLASLPMATTMDDVIETLLPSITTVVISLKAWLMMRNREQLQHLFRITERLEEIRLGSSDTVSAAAEQSCLRRAGRSFRRLLVGMSGFCYSAILWRIVSTIWLQPQRRLLWRSWFPFDWERTALGYRTALGFQIVCNVYIGVLYSTVDTFGPMAYGTLASFLDVLAMRLQRLGTEDKSKKPYERPTSNRAERALVECVCYHTWCLAYNRCLDRLLAVNYGVQFMASVLVLCLTAFMLSSVTRPADDPAKFAFLLMYMGNMGMELFIPCWYGSLVRAQSERLSGAVFEGGWVEMGVRYRRSMMVFVEGVRRPMVMYTWKRVFVIALPTFVTVGRAAYSLLSCLKGV